MIRLATSLCSFRRRVGQSALMLCGNTVKKYTQLADVENVGPPRSEIHPLEMHVDLQFLLW
jgi:hypothetical protein